MSTWRSRNDLWLVMALSLYLISMLYFEHGSLERLCAYAAGVVAGNRLWAQDE